MKNLITTLLKIKNIWNYISLALLTISTIYFYNENVQSNENYKVAMTNYKAKIAENNHQSIVYKLYIDELANSNDYLLYRIDSLKNTIKVKDRNITQLQYLSSTYSHKDSIVWERDTIFKTGISLDTVLIDKYYKLKLVLEYPSTIVVTPEFKSEKLVVFNSIRETIHPKKIWPLYWFQKKHTIVEVVVKETNPYQTNNQERFIEILK